MIQALKEEKEAATEVASRLEEDLEQTKKNLLDAHYRIRVQTQKVRSLTSHITLEKSIPIHHIRKISTCFCYYL